MSFGGTEGSGICENWIRIAGSLVVVVGWLGGRRIGGTLGVVSALDPASTLA
jgi:hypothetical protein